LNDDLLNDFLLERFPNPERIGCPDDKTLRAFAEDRLPPGSSPLDHVSSCSECYAEYRHYRQDWKEAEAPGDDKHSQTAVAISIDSERSRPAAPVLGAERQTKRSKVLPWAVAASVLAILGGGIFVTKDHRSSIPVAQVASDREPVFANVDLFNAVTTRGSSNDEPMPLEEVALPSSMVNLTVTLPRFSHTGSYQVLVSKDRAAKDVVARGVGQASEADKKVMLSVSLDLRHAAPGMYFLATVRGSDNGTYYYPLKIK
jgi:hypothetical protein